MKSKRLIYCMSLTLFLLNNDSYLAAQHLSPKDKRSEKKSEHTQAKFLRLVKDNAGIPESLETSITRYRNEDGSILVDLIGAVHVGERKYYQRLNHQFEQYESMLYELVAPPQSRVPDLSKATNSSNPIHWLQNSMQRMLGLESQLELIDYKKANFVHADLSPREMQQKMAERGDTAWSVGLRAVSEMMQQQSQAQQSGSASLGNEITDFNDLFDVISNPAKLKTMMATQFAASGSLDAGLGSTLNQLLITDRNQAAMKVLKRELDAGKTKIGIFYGAAHMPDFEKRLISELGLKKTRQAWVQAWDLKSAPRKSTPTSGLSDMFFQLIDSLDTK